MTKLDGVTPLKSVMVAAKTIIGGKTVSYTVYSASDGTFTISNPTTGTYTLNALLSRYSFSPVTGGNTIGEQWEHYFRSRDNWCCEDQRERCNPGLDLTAKLAGVTKGTATTDAQGKFSLNGLAAGTYTLTVTHTGNTFTVPAATVTFTAFANSNAATINALP